MYDESIPRPSKSYLRLSLRTLIVVVLVIGVWLGWIVRNAGIQRDAVSAIQKARGGVSYDWQWENGRFKRGASPWWPKWLSDCVGVDYFGNVVAVGDIHATDADMIHVGNLARLEDLRLGGPNEVTDDGVANVERLTCLKSLDLSGFFIGDAGIAHLGAITGLESLSLTFQKISDSGLEHLEGLKRLNFLVLSETNITDAGLAHLKGLTSLETLYLGGTKISDAGLTYIKGLTRLKYLNVVATKVTEAGLEELRRALPNTTIDPRPDTSQRDLKRGPPSYASSPIR